MAVADAVATAITAVASQKREEDPNLSYSASLHKKGLNEILKKIGEEASETIIAAKSDNKDELIHEIADLWFHCLVLLSKKDLTVDDVTNELKKRSGTSGIEEKKNRK